MPGNPRKKKNIDIISVKLEAQNKTVQNSLQK